MKNIIYLLLVINLACIELSAQVPNAIPYQAVARDNAGALIINQNISIRFGIYSVPSGGVAIYQETHSATTNDLGLFVVNVGQGTVTSGSFSSIIWGAGNKFLEVELDAAGGSNYTLMGRSQMLSVPYALHAEKSSGILDSLVLRDSTGDIRMVMNPNTGTFKMMHNDTVWYMMQVSSPSYERYEIGSNGTLEKFTASNGDYTYRESYNGQVVKSTTSTNDGSGNNTFTETTYKGGDIKTITSHTSGNINKTETTVYDDNGLISQKSTTENGITTILNYKDGVLVSKMEYGKDINSKTTNYYPNGNISSVVEWINTYNILHEKTTNYDSTGNVITGNDKSLGVEKWASANGDTTSVQGGIITVSDSAGLSNSMNAGESVQESPGQVNTTTSDGSKQENGTVTMTEGLDPNDPSQTTGGISLTDDMTNDKSVIKFKPNNIDIQSPGVTIDGTTEMNGNFNAESGSNQFNLDGTGIHLFSGPNSFSVTPSGFSWAGTVTLTQPTLMSHSTNSIFFGTSEVTLSSGPTTFSVTPTLGTFSGTLSVSGALNAGALSVSGPVSLSSLTLSSPLTLNGCTVTGSSSFTNGSSSLIIGPSSITTTCGSSTFTVTPTLSSWAGTLSCSSPNGGNIFVVENPGINLTSGTNLFSVTPTAGFSVAGTLSLASANGGNIFLTNNSGISLTSGPNSFSVTPTLTSWAGTVSITGPSFSLSSSSINLSSGSNLFTVTPTLGSYAGTLSLTSANGGSVFLSNNSGLSLTSGTNSFAVTPTSGSWAGTLSCSSANNGNLFVVDNTNLRLSSGNGGHVFLATSSGLSLTSGTNSFAVTPTSGTWAGTLSCSSANGGNLFVVDNTNLRLSSGNGGHVFLATSSGLSLTSGTNSFAVTPTSGTWAGTLSCSSANNNNLFVVDNTNLRLSSGNGGHVFLATSSGLSLTSGTNIFSVTPSSCTYGGTLSCSSANGGNIFVVDNTGLSLTSGSNILTISSSSCTMSGAASVGGLLTITSSSGISIPSGGLIASGAISAGSLSGNGGSITLINASNISSGTLGDGRLSANIPKLNQFNNFTAPIFVAATPGQDAVTGIANGQSPGPPSNLAGKFYGNVQITGNLTKGSGTFKIDHPLDPLNKYLYHSFVESPDMMNIYSGTIVLDKNGNAIVELPDWFESLNKDFHYQLTCIGGFAQVYINKEISNNRFEIAGGKEGMKVSWMVTGVRHDAYANKHRIIVEEEKPSGEKGFYLHPEAFESE